MKINLNSPQGNVFVLVSTIAGLMSKEDSDVWVEKTFKLESYDEIVEECKVKAKELSEKLGEEIEIYSSENYEMEVNNE